MDNQSTVSAGAVHLKEPTPKKERISAVRVSRSMSPGTMTSNSVAPLSPMSKRSLWWNNLAAQNRVPTAYDLSLTEKERPENFTQSSLQFVRTHAARSRFDLPTERFFTGTEVTAKLRDVHARCSALIGESVWVGEKDGTLSVFEFDSGNVKFRTRRRDYFVFSILEVGVHVWVGYSDGMLRVFDREQMEVLKEIREHAEGGAIYAMLAACGGRCVFTASGDFIVNQWDAVTCERIGIFRGHHGGVRCLCMSGQHLYSGSDDNTVRCWDVISGQCAGVFEGHTSSVRALCTSGSQLWSASEDNTIRIWDVNTGDCIHVILEGHTGHIHNLVLVGSKIWSSSYSTVFIWDVQTFELQGQFQHHVGYITSMLVVHQSVVSRVWTAAADGVINVWNTESLWSGALQAASDQRLLEVEEQVERSHMKGTEYARRVVQLEEELKKSRSVRSRLHRDLEDAKQDAHRSRIEALKAREELEKITSVPRTALRPGLKATAHPYLSSDDDGGAMATTSPPTNRTGGGSVRVSPGVPTRASRSHRGSGSSIVVPQTIETLEQRLHRLLDVTLQEPHLSTGKQAARELLNHAHHVLGDTGSSGITPPTTSNAARTVVIPTPAPQTQLSRLQLTKQQQSSFHAVADRTGSDLGTTEFDSAEMFKHLNDITLERDQLLIELNDIRACLDALQEPSALSRVTKTISTAKPTGGKLLSQTTAKTISTVESDRITSQPVQPSSGGPQSSIAFDVADYTESDPHRRPSHSATGPSSTTVTMDYSSAPLNNNNNMSGFGTSTMDLPNTTVAAAHWTNPSNSGLTTTAGFSNLLSSLAPEQPSLSRVTGTEFHTRSGYIALNQDIHALDFLAVDEMHPDDFQSLRRLCGPFLSTQPGTVASLLPSGDGVAISAPRMTTVSTVLTLGSVSETPERMRGEDSMLRLSGSSSFTRPSAFSLPDLASIPVEVRNEVLQLLEKYRPGSPALDPQSGLWAGGGTLAETDFSSSDPRTSWYKNPTGAGRDAAAAAAAAARRGSATSTTNSTSSSQLAMQPAGSMRSFSAIGDDHLSLPSRHQLTSLRRELNERLTALQSEVLEAQARAAAVEAQARGALAHTRQEHPHSNRTGIPESATRSEGSTIRLDGNMQTVIREVMYHSEGDHGREEVSTAGMNTTPILIEPEGTAGHLEAVQEAQWLRQQLQTVRERCRATNTAFERAAPPEVRTQYETYLLAAASDPSQRGPLEPTHSMDLSLTELSTTARVELDRSLAIAHVMSHAFSGAEQKKGRESGTSDRAGAASPTAKPWTPHFTAVSRAPSTLDDIADTVTTIVNMKPNGSMNGAEFVPATAGTGLSGHSTGDRSAVSHADKEAVWSQSMTHTKDLEAENETLKAHVKLLETTYGRLPLQVQSDCGKGISVARAASLTTLAEQVTALQSQQASITNEQIAQMSPETLQRVLETLRRENQLLRTAVENQTRADSSSEELSRSLKKEQERLERLKAELWTMQVAEQARSQPLALVKEGEHSSTGHPPRTTSERSSSKPTTHPSDRDAMESSPSDLAVVEELKRQLTMLKFSEQTAQQEMETLRKALEVTRKAQTMEKEALLLTGASAKTSSMAGQDNKSDLATYAQGGTAAHPDGPQRRGGAQHLDQPGPSVTRSATDFDTAQSILFESQESQVRLLEQERQRNLGEIQALRTILRDHHWAGALHEGNEVLAQHRNEKNSYSGTDSLLPSASSALLSSFPSTPTLTSLEALRAEVERLKLQEARSAQMFESALNEVRLAAATATQNETELRQQLDALRQKAAKGDSKEDSASHTDALDRLEKEWIEAQIQAKSLHDTASRLHAADARAWASCPPRGGHGSAASETVSSDPKTLRTGHTSTSTSHPQPRNLFSEKSSRGASSQDTVRMSTGNAVVTTQGPTSRADELHSLRTSLQEVQQESTTFHQTVQGVYATLATDADQNRVEIAHLRRELQSYEALLHQAKERERQLLETLVCEKSSGKSQSSGATSSITSGTKQALATLRRDLEASEKHNRELIDAKNSTEQRLESTQARLERVTQAMELMKDQLQHRADNSAMHEAVHMSFSSLPTEKNEHSAMAKGLSPINSRVLMPGESSDADADAKVLTSGVDALRQEFSTVRLNNYRTMCSALTIENESLRRQLENQLSRDATKTASANLRAPNEQGGVAFTSDDRCLVPRHASHDSRSATGRVLTQITASTSQSQGQRGEETWSCAVPEEDNRLRHLQTVAELLRRDVEGIQLQGESTIQTLQSNTRDTEALINTYLHPMSSFQGTRNLSSSSDPAHATGPSRTAAARAGPTTDEDAATIANYRTLIEHLKAELVKARNEIDGVTGARQQRRGSLGSNASFSTLSSSIVVPTSGGEISWRTAQVADQGAMHPSGARDDAEQTALDGSFAMTDLTRTRSRLLMTTAASPDPEAVRTSVVELARVMEKIPSEVESVEAQQHHVILQLREEAESAKDALRILQFEKERAVVTIQNLRELLSTLNEKAAARSTSTSGATASSELIALNRSLMQANALLEDEVRRASVETSDWKIQASQLQQRFERLQNASNDLTIEHALLKDAYNASMDAINGGRLPGVQQPAQRSSQLKQDPQGTNGKRTTSTSNQAGRAASGPRTNPRSPTTGSVNPGRDETSLDVDLIANNLQSVQSNLSRHRCFLLQCEVDSLRNLVDHLRLTIQRHSLHDAPPSSSSPVETLGRPRRRSGMGSGLPEKDTVPTSTYQRTATQLVPDTSGTDSAETTIQRLHEENARLSRELSDLNGLRDEVDRMKKALTQEYQRKSQTLEQQRVNEVEALNSLVKQLEQDLTVRNSDQHSQKLLNKIAYLEQKLLEQPTPTNAEVVRAMRHKGNEMAPAGGAAAAKRGAAGGEQSGDTCHAHNNIIGFYVERERQWNEVNRLNRQLREQKMNSLIETNAFTAKLKSLAYMFETRPTLLRSLYEVYKLVASIPKLLNTFSRAVNQRQLTRKENLDHIEELVCAVDGIKEGNRWIISNLFTAYELQHLGASPSLFVPDGPRPTWKDVSLPDKYHRLWAFSHVSSEGDPLSTGGSVPSSLPSPTTLGTSRQSVLGSAGGGSFAARGALR